jgi:hypothetical protein
MIELSFCLPMFRSKYIAWLFFESLIRQQKINFEWELILMEEQNDETFGYDEIEKYISSLKQIGCSNIIYEPLSNHIPLGTKTQELIKKCNVNSKVVTFSATDFYNPPLSVYNQFNALKDGKYDCYRSTKTIFYNISTDKVALYDTSNKPYMGDTSERGLMLELARKIRGLRKRLWGIDFNLYKELLQITQNNIRVFEDKTDSWKYGVATHGLNNISGKKREKMFEREENGMIFIDHKLEDYIPLEVINRLKDSKQYISIHKKLH